MSSAGLYYTTYVLKSETIRIINTMTTLIPMFTMGPACVFLFKKFGRRNVALAGCIISIISSAIILVDPYNSTLFLVTSLVAIFGYVPLTSMIFSLTADISEYGWRRTGIRTDALSVSGLSFSQKVGVGLGSACIGWVLAFGKFDDVLEIQTAYTEKMIIGLNFVIPAVCFAIISIALVF